MEKINGIIHDGKVYVADPEHSRCKDCDLGGACKEMESKYDVSLCVFHGAKSDDDFGYCYSQELTDKINNHVKLD